MQPPECAFGADLPSLRNEVWVVTDFNPQAKQMADESMVRNLSAQAAAIWPQELPLVLRYGLPANACILDAGCGTGEISSRLAEIFPDSSVVGVDIVDEHLQLARTRYARFSPRLSFEHQDLFDLRLPDDRFDLVVCRHVLHAVPHAERVIAELVRVARPGGYLHLIPEDYGMLEFQRSDSFDPRNFWYAVPTEFGRRTDTDLFIGRDAYTMLAGMNLDEIRMDYVVVDTLRTPRETFAAILEAWRDGYSESIGELTSFSRESAITYFDAMIANIRDARRYAVWFVPVASARVPLPSTSGRAST
jgi:ubiquinone/menaquinone biosynthesis C-methylase UbiE